jgi:sterol carrier protein 2
LYTLGLTGIPVTNVNNNCATGSTAVYHANNAVRSGTVDCALALGFERMGPGSLKSSWPDRLPPLALLSGISMMVEAEKGAENFGPNTPRWFSNAAQEYFDKYGGNINHLAQIGRFF